MIENLISNISDKSIQNFIRSRNSSFKEYKEDLSYILQDKTLFQNLYKLGEISYGNSDELLVFYCAYKGELSSKSSKRTQFEIAKKVLKEDFKDGAIFVFYDDKGKFRFSFIRKNYGDKTEKLSNWKRFTYFVDKQQQTNRTFIDTIGSCNFDSLEHIQDKFNLEPISKEFFKGYKDHYEKFCNYMLTNKVMLKNFEAFLTDGSNKAVRDYVKKLLGRIVFLHFLQKKGWMGVPKNSKDWLGGDTNFLENLFKSCSREQQENFLDEVLEPMFFNSLNSPRENDLYDTKTSIGIVRIPYLNGGLFEKDKLDEPDSKFPSSYFKDLFEFFNQYNFTIDENDPNDAEVGVDPEMLGHIFENLLEDNKDKGAFYTPKEIVHYMCQESLIEYLNTSLKTISNIEREQLSNLIKYHDLGHNIVTRIDEVNECLDKVKICDPAIGSGAFPMGLLHEIFQAKQTLWLYKYQNLNNFPASEVKLNIIQNSIYGVDIEKGAVDIARLRFWLSLVVDEDKPKPLPNLDYKIVVGNSLVGKLDGEIIDIDWSLNSTAQSLFGKDFEKQKATLLQIISEKQKEFFTSNNYKQKLSDEIRNLKIDLLINQLELMIDQQGLIIEPNEFLYRNKPKEKFLEDLKLCYDTKKWSKLIANLRKLKNSRSNTLCYFDWRLDFPEVLNELINQNPGFDIVIGNPPYVRRTTLNENDKNYFAKKYVTAYKQYDLYILFIERGLTILNINGNLHFINPNKFFSADYGFMLRKEILSKYSIIQIHDLSQLKVFENALTYPCLLQIKKTLSDNNYLRFYTVNEINNLNSTDLDGQLYSQSKLKSSAKYEFIFENDPIKQRVISKIEKGSNPLSYYFESARGLPNSKITYNNCGYTAIKSTFVKKYYIINERVKVTINDKNLQKKFITIFNDDLIILPRTVKCLQAAIKPNNEFLLDRIYYLIPLKMKMNILFVLAQLNSKLINFWFEHKYSSTKVQGGYFDLRGTQILSIPIRKESENKSIIDLVKLLLTNISVHRNISDINNQIDNLLYKLYDLTYEEVRVVDPEFSLTQSEYESISLD